MKDFKIYISLATVLLIVYLVAQYNKPAPISWQPTLYYKDKMPLGTYVLHRQLNNIFPGARVVKTNASLYEALGDSTKNGNYIVISKGINGSKTDYGQLVKYMKAGNSVFMAAFRFEGKLADTLKINTAYEAGKTNASVNFVNPHLQQHQDYTFTKDISNQYFAEFDTTKAEVIAKNNYGRSVLISYKFGAGKLYLCSDPLLFTNFSLVSNSGANFAAKALSYMPETKNIYWDELQNGDIPEDESPVRVFLSNENLQWAWYLCLAGMLVFVMFEIKRRQRIIPVIEPLANSTLDFVNIVGQVYYEKRDNSNIAQKKILYLFTHLRDKYQLNSNSLDNEFVERLASKTGIEPKFAAELIGYIRFIAAQTKVNDSELIELNKLIERFYKQSR